MRSAILDLGVDGGGMGIDIAVAGAVVCQLCFLVDDGEGIGKNVAGGRVGKKDAYISIGSRDRREADGG